MIQRDDSEEARRKASIRGELKPIHRRERRAPIPLRIRQAGTEETKNEDESDPSCTEAFPVVPREVTLSF